MIAQYKNMELYSNENNFNIFYEKKRRDLKNLQMLNEFVKPNPYFVYFMFKDTIHVDDYGSIKETLFKFPSMTRVSYSRIKIKLINYLSIYRELKTRRHGSTFSATMSTQRLVYVMMSMRMSGRSRSLAIAQLPSSISARPPLLLPRAIF